MTFFWSEFTNRFDSVPKYREAASFSAFVQQKMHFTVGDKQSIGLWNPVRYTLNTPRRKTNVEELCAIVFDFDDKSVEYMANLRARVSMYEHVFHTSAGHLQPGKLNRFRLILPLNRPATRKEFLATRQAFAQANLFWGEDDAQARHENVLFYLPSHLPGAPHDFSHVHGRIITVESASSYAPPLKASKTTETPVTGEIVGTPGHHDNFIRRWASSPLGSDARHWYDIFKEGERVSDVGGRDHALQSAAWSLVNRMTPEQLESVDETVILDFVEASIDATPGEENDRITIDHFKDKLRRARRDILADRTGGLTSQQAATFMRGLMKNAQVAEIRPELPPDMVIAENTRWTPEEVNEFSEKYFENGSVKPVLGFKGKYVVFSKDRAFSRFLESSELVPYAKQEHLSLAANYDDCPLEGVWLHKQKGQEWIYKSGQEFFNDYGTVVSEIKGSFVGKSRYNASTRVFTEVVNPMRIPEPQYSPALDGYFRTMCRTERDYHALMAWLQRFPDLMKPSNVLLLSGNRDMGKSMFSYGLARYWDRLKGSDPGSYFGDFQDLLPECPYIDAEEGLPPEISDSKAFRTFSTSRSHSINRKNQPKVTFAGCLRMIISVNDPDDLKFKEDNLNHASIDAIEQRVLRIQVSDAAKAYIAEQGGDAWMDTVVQGNGLIKHVEWLRYAYTAPAGMSTDSRFASTSGPENRMHDRAKIDQKHVDPLCAVIWKCLTDLRDGKAKEAWQQHHICRSLIERVTYICVSSKIVIDAALWDNANQNRYAPRPSPAVAARALKLISDSVLNLAEGHRLTVEEAPDRPRVWPLDNKFFKKWASDSGYSDDAIQKALYPSPDQINEIGMPVPMLQAIPGGKQ